MEYKIFAVCRVPVTSDLEGLILRSSYAVNEHALHYLLYSKKKRKIIGSMELARSFVYEGEEADKETWIIDFNKDGMKDFIIRQWVISASLNSTPRKDTLQAYLFNMDKFIPWKIKDTTVVSALKKKFPFHEDPSVAPAKDDLMLSYLNSAYNNSGNMPKEQWAIITGSNKSLNDADYEIHRVSKLMDLTDTAEMDYFPIDVYEKNNKYYSVVGPFATRETAEKVLLKVKNRFSKFAYIRNIYEWCNRRSFKNGFFECFE